MVLLRTLLFSVFCFGLFTVAHCQKSDKGKLKKVYLDEDNVQISRVKFKRKIDYAYNIDTRVYTDSILYNKLYVRNSFGKIGSPTDLATFRSELRASLGSEIDFSQDVALGYFPESVSCIGKYSSHKFYLNELRFNQYDIPYYAVLDPEAENPEYLFQYYVDSKHIIKTYFPNAVSCDFWIVLRPDGSYRTYMGEGGPFIFSELQEWDEEFIHNAEKGLIQNSSKEQLSVSESQIAKRKEIYLDESNNKISKGEFMRSINNAVNLDVKFTTDTLDLYKLYTRQRFGEINPQKLTAVQSEIKKSLQIDIDFSKDIAFGYFPELPKCNKEFSGYSFYLNEPRFNDYNIPYYAVLSPKSPKEQYTFPHYVDTTNIFEKIFADELVVCNIWMVLRPNGQFRVYLGEGGPAIFDNLHKKWTYTYITKSMKGIFQDSLR